MIPRQDSSVIRGKSCKTIDLERIKFRGYAFQIEMKFTAWKFGFNIVEVPIIFTDRREGASKMSGGIVNEAIWGVVKMKINSFFRSYKRKDHGRIPDQKRNDHQ